MAPADALGCTAGRRGNGATHPRPASSDAMPMAPPQNGATASPPEPDMVARLRELAEMRGSGLLNEEEFTAAKARLLQG